MISGQPNNQMVLATSASTAKANMPTDKPDALGERTHITKEVKSIQENETAQRIKSDGQSPQLSQPSQPSQPSQHIKPAACPRCTSISDEALKRAAYNRLIADHERYRAENRRMVQMESCPLPVRMSLPGEPTDEERTMFSE